MDDLAPIREALGRLKLRLAGGEIDEPGFDRLKDKILSDLTPDERARLEGTPTPRPVRRAPGRIGPSGKATQIPGLSELELVPGVVLLEQWRIVRELGRGGFGAVFEAEDVKLGRRLAVKVLDPAMAARSDLLGRFRREVAVMRELAHPRVVRVFDYREDEGQHLALISMEHVVGCDVRALQGLARSSGERVPAVLALAIFEQALEALAAAHEGGVIHRDVTPGNILLAGGTAAELLAAPGRDPEVKLVDFGIAGLVDRSELSARSRVLGTAAYVAPEVLDPDAEITAEADTFGAGAVVYELLTGKTPMVTGYSPAGARGPDLSRGEAEVVSAAVRPAPADRPTPAQALGRLHAARERERHERQREERKGELRQRLGAALERGDEAAVEATVRALAAELEEGQTEEVLDRARRWLEERSQARKEAARRAEAERRKAEAAARRAEEERRQEAERRKAEDKRRREAAAARQARVRAAGPARPPRVTTRGAASSPSPWAVAGIVVVVAVVVVAISLKAGRGWVVLPPPRPTPALAPPRPGVPEAGAEWRDPAIGMRFRLVPAGTFQMGSPSSEPERDSDERRHRVTITRAYWMGETEVTQGQWRAVTGKNPSYFSSCGDDCPVENVSWHDAVRFANALSGKAGYEQCYRVSGDSVTFKGLGCEGYRLPTEAEWEWAARAGTTTPFSTGDNLTTDQANYDGNYPYNGNRKGRYRQKTVAVRTFSANAWGLYEVHGNVWEWCWDRYGSYPGGSVTDPTGPSSGSDRVLRGGSWVSNAGFCRSAYRSGSSPGDRGSNLGLRLARTAP